MIVGDMTCRELVELVTDYLDGAMPAADRARFDRHLAECEGCVEYVDQMRRTIAAVGTVTEESVDPHVRDALLDAFRGWTSRS